MRKIPQALIPLALCSALVLPMCPTTAFATSAEMVPGNNDEVYVSDTYSEDIRIETRERGRCTDSYSKAWCDAHGFTNNRPVPGSVKLNAKERACYSKLVINGTFDVIRNFVVAGPGGALYASADATYKLFACLF